MDITYVSPAPANRRHRSRVDALITLGLSPYAKAIKHMSREEIADMAVEIREKLLVAYQFDRLGNECLELVRNGDDIVVIPCPKADEIPLDGILASDVVLADNRDPVTAVKLPEKLYFGFGNITIVEWGRLVPDNAFHSLTELYPLGFKCVRQEHDIALDRVVDCCCEVLSQSQKTDSGQEEMVPLFRISVCWMLGRRGDERCVRVYEGRSPQLAWQAVLLEQIGLEQNANEPLALCTQNLASTDPCPRSNETPPSDGVVALCSGAAETTQEAVYSDCSPAPERVAIMEEADDEETRLRQELLSIRREHMKSLRSSQVIVISFSSANCSD